MLPAEVPPKPLIPTAAEVRKIPVEAAVIKQQNEGRTYVANEIKRCQRLDMHKFVISREELRKYRLTIEQLTEELSKLGYSINTVKDHTGYDKYLTINW